MIGKKINQLATELAPVSTDLTIIGDPISGVSKKITLAQLGAIFSGAVSFYNDLASFPATGDINVIYCAKDTQKLYLWSGSAYVEVFPSQALLDTYQLRSEKGNANGYASLDSGGKVPISQLPSSIMEYKGTWNASTNTPTLANGTGDTGDVYICNVAGTVNFGAGAITFAVGDYVIYSGSIWQRSSGAVGTVTSVALTVGGDAISVSGSPLTTSGTLGLTFNGTTAQYIRGNGTLETFPTSLISGTGNVNAIPKFTANTVLGNSVMEDDGNFVSMRGLKLNLIAGTGNSINFQQASGIIAAGLGYSSIGAASSTGIKFYLDQNVTTRSFVLDTTTITSDTERTYSMPNSSGTLALTSDIPSLTGYVPYTGATANVNLGAFSLSAYDLIIDHTSGSGVAASITKGGSGEALTVVKSSGSGNAASITGGVTLLSELHLTTDLADAYIASATNWNTAYSLRITSATSPLSITSNVISIAQSSGSTDGYLSSTDWTTFNNKQSTLTNPVTGTGTTNYLPKFTGASTIGNSIVQDNGSTVTIGGSLTLTASSGFPSVGLLNRSSDTTLYMVSPASGFTLTDSSLNTIYNATPTAHNWNISNALKMTLNASGRLLVGTTSDDGSSILQIKGPLAITRTTSSETSKISMEGNFIFDAANTYNMVFRHNGGELVRFWSSGNVLIGSTQTDAGYKLDVTGTGRFTSHLISNSPGGGVNAATFYDRTGAVGAEVDQYGGLNAYSGILNNNGNYSSGSSGTALVFKAGAIEQFRVSATNMSVVGSVTAGGSYLSSGNAVFGVTSNSNNMYIGGGSYTPAELWLQAGTSFMRFDVNGSNAMYINSSRNVGIGTTSPVMLLSVKGSGSYNGAISIDNGNTTGGGALFIRQNGVSSGFFGLLGGALGSSDRGFAYYAEVGLGHTFFVNDGTRVLDITSNGRVGIGTSSPSSKLHVKGVLSIERSDAAQISTISNEGGNFFISSASGFNTIFQDGSTERIRITTSGNVGIGTTTPGARLQVAGTVEANGSLYRAVFGTTVQDADMTGITGGNGSELQIQASSTTRGAFLTLGGGMAFGEAMGGIAFYNSNNVDGKRCRAFIVGGQEGATSGEQGSYLSFGTVDNTGTTPSEKLKITRSGSAEFSGSIKTGEPDTGFGRAAFKIGSRQSGAAFGVGGYIPISIDGTVYYINLNTSTP